MTSELSLRPLRPGDGLALADLHRRAILALSWRFYSRAQLESWAHGIDPDAYARIATSTETFLIAETPDLGVIGFCSWLMKNAETGQIRGLYVDPDHQSGGAGKLLLGSAEAAIAAAGARQIVIEASLAAVPFYVSRGYREEHREQRPTRGGLAILVRWMRKDLTP